jgi:hypothetical protein
MSNTLEILTLESGQVQTKLLLQDGCSVLEVHPDWKDEAKVLRGLRENEYYKGLQGEWVLKFPIEHKMFHAKRLFEVIMQGLVYVHMRDLPDQTDTIC